MQLIGNLNMTRGWQIPYDYYLKSVVAPTWEQPDSSEAKQMGHFRVFLGLCFKTSLYENDFCMYGFIFMQIKVIFYHFSFFLVEICFESGIFFLVLFFSL